MTLSPIRGLKACTSAVGLTSFQTFCGTRHPHPKKQVSMKASPATISEDDVKNMVNNEATLKEQENVSHYAGREFVIEVGAIVKTYRWNYLRVQFEILWKIKCRP